MCYQSIESCLEKFGKYNGKGFEIKLTPRGFYNCYFPKYKLSIHDYNLNKLCNRIQLVADGLWF